MWCIRRRNLRHASGCIAIHCVRIHPLRFWRGFWGVVACFTRFPSETRSGRLSGARKKRYVQYAWLKSTQKSRHLWRLFCYKLMIINHKSTFFYDFVYCCVINITIFELHYKLALFCFIPEFVSSGTESTAQRFSG